MRLLLKLAMKLVLMVVMVVVMGSVLKRGPSAFMNVPGAPEGSQFSSEEADLMSTVFKSALRLFSGTAKREELASELSDKLYAGRAGSGEMAELGIELVKPGGSSSPLDGGPAGASVANAQPGVAKRPTGARLPKAQGGAKAPVKSPALAGKSPVDQLSKTVHTDLLGRIWDRTKVYSVELSLVPVVFLGMYLVHRIRRRSRGGDFDLPLVGILPPAETEPFDMKHTVHSLGVEEFELLVALIYQRQGYRISMPAGLSGGRGGDFMLLRKSERILVQCKRLSADHKVPVERVRELQEAATAANATRAMYVVSCAFSWDARNFAKTKKMTLINARTLDELITAAREKPEEDLLEVSSWVTKLMSKVQLTPPHCPACEAAMDQVNVSHGAVWVCSQRPECRGRRSARKYQKPVPTKPVVTEERTSDIHADRVNA